MKPNRRKRWLLVPAVLLLVGAPILVHARSERIENEQALICRWRIVTPHRGSYLTFKDNNIDQDYDPMASYQVLFFNRIRVRQTFRGAKQERPPATYKLSFANSNKELTLTPEQPRGNEQPLKLIRDR